MPNPDYDGSSWMPSSVPMAPGGGVASTVAGATPKATGGGLATALPVAGAVMQGAGLLANIYGAYQADKEAGKARREEQRRFNIQQDNNNRQRQDQLTQQNFQNDITSGQYATNYQKDLNDLYGSYYQRNAM